MRQPFTTFATAALVFVAACGGGSDGGPTNPNQNPNSNRSMSARVDGTAWTATSVAAGVTNGLLIIAGSNITQTFAIAAAVNQGTGTQTVGPTSVTYGNLMVGQQSWAANGSQGGTGSITLTTLTANRAVGTFSFTLKALSQGATPASRQITSGAFDVVF
jgi:Family of unknown function (DUF6252)